MEHDRTRKIIKIVSRTAEILNARSCLFFSKKTDERGQGMVSIFKAGVPVPSNVSGFEIFAKRFGASRHSGKPSERLETAHFSLI